ncbi:MAG: hypothetical protein PUD59_05770 [bacterium]|nr:hypothetical protein [bacterium]
MDENDIDIKYIEKLEPGEKEFDLLDIDDELEDTIEINLGDINE